MFRTYKQSLIFIIYHEGAHHVEVLTTVKEVAKSTWRTYLAEAVNQIWDFV